MGVRVLKGGMLTTVQDLGRTGYQSQGFGVSGVRDVRSGCLITKYVPLKLQICFWIIRKMKRFWSLP